MESLSMQLVPVFDWLLRTTLQAALLLCLILLIQVILRGRLPIRWQYCLWLLLLIRMATPWLPESKISIFNWVPRS
ncbi:MAG: M56 family metallopeptidase, partial [Planctomycetota bacterium]